MDPEYFMRRAIELARENIEQAQGGPFGAVIVHKGEIIAEGTNIVTSINDPTAHAEIVAIRRACAHIGSFSLDECEIYTSGEPCPMCLSAIYWARISRIYFSSTREEAALAGFDDAFLYKEIPRTLAERHLPITRISIPEAEEVMLSWQKMQNKIPY